MKSEEDEAFDELARKQGSWGGGFQAKRRMAEDKLQKPWRCQHGWLRGEQCEICNASFAPKPAQDGKCKYCVDGCIACDARAQKEAIYGMNQDDWKDVVAAIVKVRDGRGIYLGCRPADVFQEWFLALGTAKVKEKRND